MSSSERNRMERPTLSSSSDPASVLGSLSESTASGTQDLFLSEEALRQLEKCESIPSTSIPVMASAISLWREDASYQQLALRVLERAVLASLPLEPGNKTSSKDTLGEIAGVLVQFVEEYWNIKETQDKALRLVHFASETKAGAEEVLSANGLGVLSRTLRRRMNDPDALAECLKCIRNLILQRKTALPLVEIQKDHLFALTLMDKHALHEPCIGAALQLLVAVASSPSSRQAQEDIIAAGCIHRVVRALKMLVGQPTVQTNGYELLKHLLQHKGARRRLDSTVGAWEFLGASEIKMYAIDKGDGVHDSALLSESAFQENYAWNPHSLLEFMRGGQEVISHCTRRGNSVEDFFSAVAQSCLLPHRNETYSEWLSRVRDYEKEAGVAILDVDLK